MEADYMYAELEMERYYMSQAVNVYIKKFDNSQLVLEARELLNEHKDTITEPLFLKIRSILTQGIIYQNLTEKQRYALGMFILDFS